MLLYGKGQFLAFFVLILSPLFIQAWDSDDFELFDLVEEINQNFYEVLGLDSSASSADIRRAYRKLSLQLHPDKNKEDNAEEKFRQLVAVAEVLKDADKRQRYDLVVEHGLPDWRQPVFYYRRVRKMGLLELAMLLTLILTIGHYLVVWSMYWERRFEMESVFLSKRKREKKSKKSNKQQGTDNQTPSDPLAMLDDPNVLAKPKLSDIIPCQMFRLVKNTILGIPSAVYWVKEEIEHWKESRRKVEEVEIEEESSSEEDEDTGDEKDRTKRRQRIDPALYEYDRTSAAPVASTIVDSNNVCDTDSSAMSNGQQSKPKKSVNDWSNEDTTKLIRAMAKYPGGTSQRWEKIAEEVGWPLQIVTKKAKSIKTSGYATRVDASAQGIIGGVQHEVLSKSGKVLGSEDSSNILAYNSNIDSQNISNGDNEHRRKTKSKQVKMSDRTLMIAQQPKQQDSISDDKKDDGANVDPCAWSQRQQKVLEKALSLYPKGTDARWDKIADEIPGKTKEECMVRYKELVEAVRRKKQSAGDNS